MRETDLPFHRHDITDREIEAVVATLKSDWITSGPQVAGFEKEFAQAVNSEFALSVNSCTAALHLALEACGIRTGDEVLVPTMTFAATAETVLYLGATPVLVDVDRETQHIDLEDATKKVTSKTKAIMPVHVAGLPCDMKKVEELAKQFSLRVIEDAAHSFPAASQGRKIGGISEATCFSFYATKTITTGEGGMLTTNSREIFDRARIMRTHGLDRDVFRRAQSPDPWLYDVVRAGYKYNMTDVAAAMGRVQLDRAEDLRQKRERICNKYNQAFSTLDCVLRPPGGKSNDIHSWHLYTMRLKPEALTIDRNTFIRELRLRKIGSSVHWIPLHLHSLYRDKFGYKSEALPNASWLADRIFSLPAFPAMSEKDSDDVIEAVFDVAKKFKR